MSTHIMAKVWPLQMSAARKAVLISLADQANDQGFCWPSVGTIAKRTCLSDRAVRLALRWLEENGFMYRQYRQGSSTYYTLTPEHGSSPETDSPLNDVHTHPEPDSGGDGTTCSPPRNEVPPEPSLNRQETANEPSKGKRTQPKRATQMPADFRPSESHERLAAEMGVSLNAEFEQFCDYHVAKGSTYKDWGRALNTWLRNARKFGGANRGGGQQRNAQGETPQQRAERMWREKQEREGTQ